MSNVESLKLYELVCGVGNQLRYVDRFSTCRRNHRENVAEHQFYTAFFTLLICEHVDAANVGIAVIRALVHDVEEHCTGDVIRPIKHGSKEVSEALDGAGTKFCNKFFHSLTNDEGVASKLFADWKYAKDSSMEGMIVKFADFLSVIAYLNQEVRSGNYLVLDNVTQLKEYCETFQTEEFNFLRPLVSQAYRLVEELDRAVQSKRRA